MGACLVRTSKRETHSKGHLHLPNVKWFVKKCTSPTSSLHKSSGRQLNTPNADSWLPLLHEDSEEEEELFHVKWSREKVEMRRKKDRGKSSKSDFLYKSLLPFDCKRESSDGHSAKRQKQQFFRTCKNLQKMCQYDSTDEWEEESEEQEMLLPPISSFCSRSDPGFRDDGQREDHEVRRDEQERNEQKVSSQSPVVARGDGIFLNRDNNTKTGNDSAIFELEEEQVESQTGLFHSNSTTPLLPISSSYNHFEPFSNTFVK